jgi:SAM-dependent methyltransferase
MTPVRQLHSKGYSVADQLLAGLACIGYLVNPNAKILDFGCGAGGLVCEFRSLGYEAFGFDIHNYLSLKDPADSVYFGFSPGVATDSSDMRVDWSKTKIPFPDNMFDLIVSTSVLEHVLEWKPAMAEIARVLNASGGVCLHLFPRGKALIEPHMLVPFGSMFQSWSWFYFCALLGFRNDYQKEFTAKVTADRNFLYTNTGVRYQTDKEMLNACWPFFSTLYFADTRFHAISTWSEHLRALRNAMINRHPVRALALLPKLRALLLANKRTEPL